MSTRQEKLIKAANVLKSAGAGSGAVIGGLAGIPGGLLTAGAYNLIKRLTSPEDYDDWDGGHRLGMGMLLGVPAGALLGSYAFNEANGDKLTPLKTGLKGLAIGGGGLVGLAALAGLAGIASTGLPFPFGVAKKKKLKELLDKRSKALV